MNDRCGGDDKNNRNHGGRNPHSSNNNRGRNHHKRSRSSGEWSFQRNGYSHGGYSESNDASADHATKHPKPSPRKPPPRQQYENHVTNHNGQNHRRRKNGQGKQRMPRSEHSGARPTAQSANERPTRIPQALLDTTSVANTTAILQWQTRHFHVPIQSEERIMNILIKWKNRERGMMRNAGNRYQEVERACRQVHMQLSQALSLRRQHMKHLNPHLGMTALGLGKEEDIRKSAALFESAVESYLNQCNITFLTEIQQKALLPKGAKHPPSPDFMLGQPTLLSTCTPVQHGHQNVVVNDFVIHWVEVKMFYAASTLAVNSKSAVGCILTKASKYVSLYGTGAMVFMYGCGKEMADMLLEVGVVALDAHPLDVRNVEAHQQTWCANKSGMILP